MRFLERLGFEVRSSSRIWNKDCSVHGVQEPSVMLLSLLVIAIEAGCRIGCALGDEKK